MLISDLIEQLINKMLAENGGECEFRRNDLANEQGCVPSQINYVISSRFTPERGFIVESRRGGGGFIRITRIRYDRTSYVMHFVNAVGEGISADAARAFIANLCGHGIISEREAQMLSAVTGENTLRAVMPPDARSALRALMLKQAVMSVIR